MTPQDALALAYEWADRGVPAFPIAISWDDEKHATNKRPLCPHGHRDAEADRGTVLRLFQDAYRLQPGEELGVGLWPGPANRVVLDVDNKGGLRGDDELDALEEEHGRLPDHPIVPTPSGGSHRWLAKPPGVHVGNADLAPGINVRSNDGWVVCPGVITSWGAWFVDEDTLMPAPLWPDWLAAKLASGQTNGQPNGQTKGPWRTLDRAALDPRDLIALEALEALGGHGAYLGGDGSVHITRPGKRMGASASIGHLGPGIVRIFSDGWPRLEQRVYDGDELAALAGLSKEAAGEAAGAAAGAAAAEPPPARTLDEAHAVFRRWLGADYDLEALDAVLATAAAEQLPGDPLWLLLISGSGNAKTETVQSFVGTGAIVVSTITSDGALLSGSPKKQRSRDATGGLLREVGERGVLVIKDVTSILSMDRNIRATVLAALREIHDGKWTRKLGVDGGRSLTWEGRFVVIGAVTTAWDQAHEVISSMGDRFLLLRMDSSVGRVAAGQQSRRNTGHEIEMRAELAAAVAGVLSTVDPTTAIDVTEAEGEVLLAAADLVTLARTGVIHDYRGDVVDAHAPEMPTRFTKELVQLMRGAVAIGMDRRDALRLAIRCARDSMPPLRLAVIEDLANHPGSSVTEVRRRLDKPRATVDRGLQALHILGVLRLDEVELPNRQTSWRYSLSDGITPEVLDRYQICEYLPPDPKERASDEGLEEEGLSDPTNISGNAPSQVRGSRQVPEPPAAPTGARVDEEPRAGSSPFVSPGPTGPIPKNGSTRPRARPRPTGPPPSAGDQARQPGFGPDKVTFEQWEYDLSGGPCIVCGHPTHGRDPAGDLRHRQGCPL